MKPRLNDYAQVYVLVNNQCYEIELTHLEVGYDFEGTGVKIEGKIMDDPWRRSIHEETRFAKADK